jgi:hypothetical protein
MADFVLFDELHLSIRVPTDLDDAACDAIRRILESRQFRSALRRAVDECIRHYPELAPVRIRISV